MMSYQKSLMTIGISILLVGSCLTMMFSGCTSFPLLSRGPSIAEQELTHRKEYQLNGSRKALQWLLANRIDQGMDRKTVSEILGQEGERKRDDNKFKSQSSSIRRGDKTYRYGPDNGGRSIYLMYRDDKLINYDAKDFQ